MRFYEEETEVFRMIFSDSGQNGKIKIDGVSSDWLSSTIRTVYPDDEGYIEISYNNTNQMIVKLYNNTMDLQETGDCEAKSANEWTTFDRIAFHNNNGDMSECEVRFDDFDINIAESPEDAEETIYIYFFDRTTGEYFSAFNFVGPPAPGYVILGGDLSSDLNNDYTYTSAVTGDSFPLSIETDFNNGEYHYINFTDITSFGTAVGYTAYYDFSTYIQMYDGQTYAFGITPVGYSEPYNNINCKTRANFWLTLWYEACIATDKRYYTSGETVNTYYKIPTVQQLSNIGVQNTNWRVGVFNVANITIFLGAILADNNPDYTFNSLTYSNSWESAGNWDPPDPATGTDTYIICIYQDTGDILWPVELFIWDLWEYFYITNGSFTPEGNIIAITPTEPVIGQNVNISFNATNNGKLTYRNLLGADTTEKVLSYFTKFTGTEYSNRRFYDYGTFQLKLYVSNGATYIHVDTDYFYINSSNATGPGEYLTVSPYYAIAGFDTMFITYKTEVDDTEIRVKDARAQNTSYGTTVDTGGGTYSFELPTGAPIGTWNVIMYGNNTHTANFTVIADENNYFRFHKNQYYENEKFGLLLTHDKKILIRFFKDNIAQGSDLIFQSNEQNQGLYLVPYDIVNPSPGKWYAEMWAVNNNIEIELLATANCTVIKTMTGDIEPGYDNILSMLAMGGAVFGGGEIGFIIMSILILIGIAVLLNRSSSKKTDGGVMFIILIISALGLSVIGWLPWWITVIAVVLTGLLFGEGLSKKLNLGGK